MHSLVEIQLKFFCLMGAHMKMNSKMYVGQSVCTFLLLEGVMIIGCAPPPPFRVRIYWCILLV